MMRGILCVSAISLCLAALAGCGDDETAPSGEPDTIRVAFQDGVSPSTSYNSTRDAVLKDDPDAGVDNVNFGTAGSDTLGSVALASGFYERRLVVRMDISSITDCSEVVSARLSIRVAPPAPESLTLDAHLITRQWTEGSGGAAAGVSWSTTDGGVPWTNGGGDFLSSVLDERTVSSDSVVTFTLSPALVMEWIQHPSSNRGIVIKTADASAGRYAIVFERESNGAARRPRLEIAYLPGG
jgi:hypothetical protein